MTAPLTGVRDYTEDVPETRFRQLPGRPEIWHERETGKVYAVYFMTDVEPPIPMLWHVPDEATLQVYYGDVELYGDEFAYDRDLSMEEIRATGAFEWGKSTELDEFAEPVSQLQSKLNRMKETQPWLEDPEVAQVYFGAWWEGRDPQQWELESTTYWQSRNEAQRDWMWLSARDPQEASRLVETNQIRVHNLFVKEGISDVNEALVDYMARKLSTGDWSEAYTQDQVQGLLYGDNATGIDGGLAEFTTEKGVQLETPAKYTTQVRDLFRQWLGPGFPPSETQISEWSKKLAQSYDANLDSLVNHLQGQRLALFPTYEDRTLSYEDIAAPWRSFVANQWGHQPDESDPFFNQIVQLNDAVEAGKRVRREGLSRGYERVVGTAMRDMDSSMRRNVMGEGRI